MISGKPLLWRKSLWEREGEEEEKQHYLNQQSLENKATEQLLWDTGSNNFDICHYPGLFWWNLSKDLPNFPEWKEDKFQEGQQNLWRLNTAEEIR